MYNNMYTYCITVRPAEVVYCNLVTCCLRNEKKNAKAVNRSHTRYTYYKCGQLSVSSSLLRSRRICKSVNTLKSCTYVQGVSYVVVRGFFFSLYSLRNA